MSNKNENKKKSDIEFFIIAIVAIGILWGLPSLISGQGFFNGIYQNIKALLYIIGGLIGIVLLFKIFSN